MHGAAYRSDPRSGSVSAVQQGQRTQGGFLRLVLFWYPMFSALLMQVLAQQFAGVWIQQPNMQGIPLHLDAPSDPARRRAVVGRVDLHAAIQMHCALAVLVITEGLQRQWQKRRPLFGKHRRYLSLGGAVNARVGPPFFPVIQVALSLLQEIGRA